MSFYSPLYLLFILGLIPLLIMYLLKKQNEDIVLSSNYLWEKTLRDVEANKPWQKLKKNLLLLLQILAFTLIVLALAKPHIFKGNINSENLIIVLDKSVTMKNRDMDGKTRFQKAKEDIEDIIKNIKGNTKVTLIAMDNKPKILTNSINDKSILKKELEKVTVNDSRENIKDTISTIKGMVKDIENYDVLFYTDKEINTDIDNLKINIIKGKGENVSIDNISYSKEDENMTVLTTVTNHSDKKQKFDLSIYGDEKLLESKEIDLKNKESKDIYFEKIAPDIKILKSEMDIEDSLDSDNIRYQAINDSLKKKALIVSDKGNIFIEKAIEINEDIEVYRTNENLEDNEKGYDLYIFDGIMPEILPYDGNIVVFNPPSNNIFEVSKSESDGELKLNNDELFKHVNLDFNIKETNTIESANWLQPILTLDEKTIMAKGEKDNQKIVVIGFDIRDTDLPLKADFPILMMNILDYTLNLKSQGNSEVVAGETINIDVSPKAEKVYIKDPNGNKQEINNTVYRDTSTQGIYTIEQVIDKEIIETHFASNIDTSTRQLEKIETNEKDIKDNNNTKPITGKDITNIVLIIALIALSFEWVVYNRGY